MHLYFAKMCFCFVKYCGILFLYPIYVKIWKLCRVDSFFLLSAQPVRRLNGIFPLRGVAHKGDIDEDGDPKKSACQFHNSDSVFL